MPYRRAALIVILVVLGGVLVLNMYRLAIGLAPDWDWSIPTLIAWWLTLAMAACGIVLLQRRLRVLMVLGLVAAAFVLLLLFLDADDFEPEWLLWSTWLLAALLAQLGLLWLPSLRRYPSRAVRWVTTVAAVLLAIGLAPDARNFFGWSEREDWFEGGMFVLSTASVTGTAAVFVLAALEAGARPPAESLPERAMLRGACPRCQSAQEFPNGASACAACGLIIHLDVEEPRCECGYLLYKLTSGQCPECGRVVSAAVKT